jgi:uncharacterized protein YcbX
VVLRILIPTPRCAVPTLAHGKLGLDREALRVLAEHNRLDLPMTGPDPVAGVYAEVLADGVIRENDRVHLLSNE